MRAKNAWRVYWTEEGRRKYRHFEGSESNAERKGLRWYEKPLESAVAFAKELKKQGHAPEIVSCRQAFIPTLKDKKPGPGFMWCPYCMKWRQFRLFKVLRKDGIPSQGANRCPVCTITEDNYYVQRYNGRIESLTLNRNEYMRRFKRG